MKNILVMTPLYPFPPFMANQKDITGRIKLFQELGYRVMVAAFPLPWQEAHPEADGKAWDIDIELMPRSRAPAFKGYPVHRLWHRCRGLTSQASLEKLRALIGRCRPDAVWFEYSSFAPLARALARDYETQIIFRAHNYESRHYFEKFRVDWPIEATPRRMPGKIVDLSLNLLGIDACESLMFKVASKVAGISREDIRRYRVRYGRQDRLSYLPYFPPDALAAHQTNRGKDTLDVFYLGADLKNNLNRSGVDFIARKLVPCLQRQRIDGIHFHVLGKSPPECYAGLPFLTLHGFVDDLNGFLADMDVAVVPVFYGTGFKVKGYECLRRGFPVVGSKRALSVFNGADGRDYFVCQEPEEFIEKLAALREADLRARTSANALSYMERDFSRAQVLHQLADILS
ncbi:MAG: glycosyltransferase [Chloroflexi bacterium]|nr:glycosyltransferase [Chloroflexota bacterium]